MAQVSPTSSLEIDAVLRSNDSLGPAGTVITLVKILTQPWKPFPSRSFIIFSTGRSTNTVPLCAPPVPCKHTGTCFAWCGRRKQVAFRWTRSSKIRWKEYASPGGYIWWGSNATDRRLGETTTGFSVQSVHGEKRKTNHARWRPFRASQDVVGFKRNQIQLWATSRADGSDHAACRNYQKPARCSFGPALQTHQSDRKAENSYKKFNITLKKKSQIKLIIKYTVEYTIENILEQTVKYTLEYLLDRLL